MAATDKLIQFVSWKEDTSVTEQDLVSIMINDIDYLTFLKNFNGGFFFNNALQFYAINSAEKIFCLKNINELITNLYKKLGDELFYFGQDIFGNQYAFNNNNEVVLFNIESAEKEHIAYSFKEFIDTLLEDTDYYTGESLILEWKSLHSDLKLNERLCPKKPFVLGGDFDISNLYNLNISKNLEYNSSIAIQIHELPDGTPIRYKIID